MLAEIKNTPDTVPMNATDKNFFIGASAAIGVCAGLVAPAMYAPIAGSLANFGDIYRSGAIAGVGFSALTSAGLATLAAYRKDDIPRYSWLVGMMAATVGAIVGCSGKSLQLKMQENKNMLEASARVVHLQQAPTAKAAANAYVYQ